MLVYTEQGVVYEVNMECFAENMLFVGVWGF